RGGIVAKCRVRHDQGAALDIVDRHFTDRAVQEWLDVAPAPVERRVLRLRLDRGDALVAGPQRMEGLRFKVRHEWRVPLRAAGGFGHGAPSWCPGSPHVFGSLASMFEPSIRMCLINTRGSTLSPLR